MWKRQNDIFSSANHRSMERSTISGQQLVTLILNICSIIAAIIIVANLKTITVKIAIRIAGLLTSGTTILVIVIAVVVLFVRLKWKLMRRFWHW